MSNDHVPVPLSYKHGNIVHLSCVLMRASALTNGKADLRPCLACREAGPIPQFPTPAPGATRRALYYHVDLFCEGWGYLNDHKVSVLRAIGFANTRRQCVGPPDKTYDTPPESSHPSLQTVRTNGKRVASSYFLCLLFNNALEMHHGALVTSGERRP